jgi:hypothetical protein
MTAYFVFGHRHFAGKVKVDEAVHYRDDDGGAVGLDRRSKNGEAGSQGSWLGKRARLPTRGIDFAERKTLLDFMRYR